MDSKKQENLQLMHQLHSQRLASASSDVSRLRGFVRDYETLVDTLTALPTKTHHQALIPLGGAALMPGRLVHTNEVLVLLGDNWFAERTALQARDIAGRRLRDCREQLKSAEQAAKLQSHWVDQGETLQSEQGIDIVEEVSEKEYAKQQERHREMVSAHQQQLRQERLQQHHVSSKAGSKKRRTGATSVTGHSDETHKTYDDLMKRLDALEDMERDEDSEEDEGSGTAKDSEEFADDLSEETDEEESSDSDSDDDKEMQPNRTAAENDDEEEEDSDEDLPADLNKFKHVKIESPMPSSERKFQYSDADPDGVEDELGDMDEVEEVIRGRTRSFTRSVDGDHPRSDSKGRDSSNDSRTGGGSGGTGGGGPRGPVARRVSWADQSPYIVSEDGGAGGVIKIRYVATQKASGEEETGTKDDSSSVETVTAEGTPLVTVITIPSLDAGQPEPMEVDSKSSRVKTPADLVRLAGGGTADTRDKETQSSVSITVAPDPPTPVVVTALPTITATAPRKPKKSILKRAPSQECSVVDNVAGVSWLQSAESVPITNVYHHEPIVDPSLEEASPKQDMSVPTAVKSRVVARDEAVSTGTSVKGEAEEQELPAKKMSKFKAGRLKQ